MEAGTSKTTTCNLIFFDRAAGEPYYTPPMAGAPSDLVDCARLADAGATLERDYPLAEFRRLEDVLAEPSGRLHVRFVFERLGAKRVGATLSIEAVPRLTCQRCLQPFDLTVTGGSRIEFAQDETGGCADTDREICGTQDGRASLAALAEEELLLALPIAPTCPDREVCAGRSAARADGAPGEVPAPTRRPFAGLQDLIKRT